jgi:aspartate-semialdehyde dehydrogenase
MKKVRAGILAATGTVGQRFVQLLASHPKFEITALAGSKNSAGGVYRDVCAWQVSEDPPQQAAKMVARECIPELNCDAVFSCLPTEQATDLEPQFATAGYKLFTNAAAYRMQPDVPLLVKSDLGPTPTDCFFVSDMVGKPWLRDFPSGVGTWKREQHEKSLEQ